MNVLPNARQEMEARSDLKHEDRRNDLRRLQDEAQRGDCEQRKTEARITADDRRKEDEDGRDREDRERHGSSIAARLRSSASSILSTSASWMHMGGTMRRMLRSVPDLLTTSPFSRVLSKISAVSLRRGSLALAIRDQFDRQHQSVSAHVADDLVLLMKSFEDRLHPRADLGEFACRPSWSMTLQHGAAGRAGQPDWRHRC